MTGAPASPAFASTLRLRAVMTLPGYLMLLMVLSQAEAGDPVLLAPALAFLAVLLPLRWAPFPLVAQVVLIAGTLALRPHVVSQVGWLGSLFLVLGWVVLGLLGYREQQARRAASAPR